MCCFIFTKRLLKLIHRLHTNIIVGPNLTGMLTLFSHCQSHQHIIRFCQVRNNKFEDTCMLEHTLMIFYILFFFHVYLPSCHSIHTMEHEFYECPEYLSNTPAEVERTEEYEYEVQFFIFLLNKCTLKL